MFWWFLRNVHIPLFKLTIWLVVIASGFLILFYGGLAGIIVGTGLIQKGFEFVSTHAPVLTLFLEFFVASVVISVVAVICFGPSPTRRAERDKLAAARETWIKERVARAKQILAEENNSRQDG